MDFYEKQRLDREIRCLEGIITDVETAIAELTFKDHPATRTTLLEKRGVLLCRYNQAFGRWVSQKVAEATE